MRAARVHHDEVPRQRPLLELLGEPRRGAAERLARGEILDGREGLERVEARREAERRKARGNARKKGSISRRLFEQTGQAAEPGRRLLQRTLDAVRPRQQAGEERREDADGHGRRRAVATEGGT